MIGTAEISERSELQLTPFVSLKLWGLDLAECNILKQISGTILCSFHLFLLSPL